MFAPWWEVAAAVAIMAIAAFWRSRSIRQPPRVAEPREREDFSQRRYMRENVRLAAASRRLLEV
jgi:hypothetical protein